MIFSKQMPVPAWMLLLLLMNMQMAQLLEIVLVQDMHRLPLDLYHPDILEIILTLFGIATFVYFALYTDRLYLLIFLFALDSLLLIEKIDMHGRYLAEQVALFIAFWLLPISLLLMRRYDIVPRVRAKISRNP